MTPALLQACRDRVAAGLFRPDNLDLALYELGLAQAQRRLLLAEVDRLTALVNTTEIDDFLEGVRLEAAHQRERWGTPHDREKSAEHWFWLVGYLAGKALRAAMTDDLKKAKHHCISTAAALLHWHATISASEHADADLRAHDDHPGDPTPWCAHCGAVRKSDCNCGPLPEND